MRRFILLAVVLSAAIVPVAAPSFMYYLNPTSLDRNLEWDMKTNLCPNPGPLSYPMP